MVDYELLRTEGILILRPQDRLEANDFQSLAQEVDPYIEANGKLHGLMIEAAAFPGWADFAALIAHFKFVRDHHRKIEKIAVVSDNDVLSFAPKIATHFVQAEILNFPLQQKESAMKWLKGEG